MPIRKNPSDLIGFNNALRHAITEASKDHNKTICNILQEQCKCKVIKTIEDPESLNTGISLIDNSVAHTFKNFNLFAKIVVGYITAVEFETEQDLLMFVLRWG